MHASPCKVPPAVLEWLYCTKLNVPLACEASPLPSCLTSALFALPLSHCSCYDPLPDSRTGADMLPWLLRGAVLAGGRADYSATHTALLYAGCAVVGVGECNGRGVVCLARGSWHQLAFSLEANAQ